MNSIPLRRLRNELFGGGEDIYKDRNAWMRRAMFWKMLAIAQKAGAADIVDKIYEIGLHGDAKGAPDESVLKHVMHALSNHLETMKKPKIEIARI